MQDSLQNFISHKKQEGNLAKQSEEATKQGVILPILHHLGWNPFDVQEVFPEYSVQNRRVDYSLRINNYDKVFIEVKRIGEDLEKHQEQLLSYAFRQGVKLAILTNGIIWWFYLPLHEGSWEQRRFYTIDLQSQTANDIIEKLTAFLSRQDVADGKAVRNAENIYNSRQKGEIIRRTLPKAWRKLLSESDDLLVEAVAESVEKLCGYKPDSEIVIEFLKEVSGETSLPATPKPLRQKAAEVTTEAESDSVTKDKPNDKAYVINSIIDSKPVSFEFGGQTYKVNSWVNLLKTFVQIIAEKHHNELEKLTTLAGRQRPYFATDSNLLRQASRVPNASLYFETHFSATGVVRLISQVLLTMGYPIDAIKINTISSSSAS